MSKVVLNGEECFVTSNGKERLVCTGPRTMSNEFKAMRGSYFNWDAEKWTVEDHPRNHFQLRSMMSAMEGPDGSMQDTSKDDPYAWWDRELKPIGDIQRPLMDHQIDMVRKALTYRYQLFAADMGLGKTMVAFEVAERLHGGNPKDGDCWYVGPNSALESVEVDMQKWAGPDQMNLMTYERMTRDFTERLKAPPKTLFLDECTNVKHHKNQRSQAAQLLADAIRNVHGNDGTVIAMSGSPTAKRPSDIWSQAEIVAPGFMREGSVKAFEQRYAIHELGFDGDGNRFNALVGWRDNEVAMIPRRLLGLMSVYRKSEILNLPPRTFEVRTCKISPRIKRVAKALMEAAPNVISGLTALRALSSGFQYNEGVDGVNGERPTVNAPCPKDDLLRTVLDEEAFRGRMIVGASFQGSLDRVKNICCEKGWDVVMVDGRGWNCFDSSGKRIKQHILEFWANNPNKVAFIGNPSSCRYGLTLVEAKTIFVFDQSFSAEHRLQFLDRNYRIGQDEACRVIDAIHLPIDMLVLQTLVENRRLEELSLGCILENIENMPTTAA